MTAKISPCRAALAAALLLASSAASRAEVDLATQLAAAESLDDTPAAAEICRRLVEADAGNLDALRKLVRASLALGDAEGARRALERLKDRVPAGDPGVLEAEGDLLARDQKNNEATEAWLAALMEEPANASLLAKLGNHFLNVLKDRENAALYFERLLALRADAGDHLIVAESAAMRRDWNTLIERTATLKSDFAADSRVKRKLPALERLIDAMLRIALLDRRIAAADPPVAVVLERGILFRELGFPEIGLPDARRARMMHPDVLSVRIAYALIAAPIWTEHERIEAWGINPSAFSSSLPGHDFLPALVRQETALRVDPAASAVRLERAALLLAHGQRGLALADIDAALAANPDDARALRLKASLLRDSGKFAAAMPLIERALSLQPDDPAILKTGIEIFADQGEFERAIALCDAFPATAPAKERKAVSEDRARYYERLQQQAPPTP